MVGITINGKHSYDEYELVLTSKSIEAPTVKSLKVDIVGADGVIDMTDVFGEPKFANRKLSFVFMKQQTQDEFIEEWSELMNRYDGRRCEIILDEDSGYYYIGRISLKYSRNKTLTTITMDVDAEPYKLKRTKTVVEITGSGTVNLTNLRKRVVPTISTTAEASISFGSAVFSVSTGVSVIPELELVTGDNSVTVTSTGTTKFEYQEGGL